MDMHDKYVAAAFRKCAAFNLHPVHDPLGDSHHTDVPFTADDEAIGDALAWFLGTLFADVDSFRYWYTQRTSVDEWRRVARALRIHGLTISDRNVIPGVLEQSP
jgi:hypothetical protein